MVASCEREGPANVEPRAGDATRRRLHPELLAVAIFRPLAGALVRVLLPLRVSPRVVELANGLAGLCAVFFVFRGELVAAALLLQVKTVLDNADGLLARRSGRTSALGRYLDTEIDLVVDIALFAALGHVTGEWGLAAFSFVALTLVLSADFNEDVLYRRTRGARVVTEPPAEAEGRIAVLLARLYRAVFGPQDRAYQGLAARRLGRLLEGVEDPVRRAEAALAYHDGLTSTVLANLGLSTQLAILGLCLVASSPEAYLWFTLGCAALLPLLQLRRELRVRRMLR
jgi:phosphatidylglycerophosphate synthase